MKTGVLFLVLATAAAFAQQGRISTVTRGVRVLGELERKLAASTQSAERETLLTDDFEERQCAAPGVPVPRADWLTQPLPSQARFSGEAVHDLGDTAIYSALFTSSNSRDMLVDVWKKSGDGWKLAIRYRCPASGDMPHQQTIPKRY